MNDLDYHELWHKAEEPPWPNDPNEHARWRFTRCLRRMLYGMWRIDVERLLARQIKHVRREAWRTIDLSSNQFKLAAKAQSVTYDRAPLILHDDVERAAPMTDAITGYHARSGFWALMAGTGQRDTMGLQEMLFRRDIHPRDGGLVDRPVYPDLVTCEADPYRRHLPVTVRETRDRKDPKTGEIIWTRETLSIADIDNPQYVIERYHDGGGFTDVTGDYLNGSQSGEAYPYRKADDEPVLPYVMYHSKLTGVLWNPYDAIELYLGSLEGAGHYTHWGHIMRQASWAQRYGIGASAGGEELIDQDGDGVTRREVNTDPSTILMFDAQEGFDGQPTLGQFGAAIDPGQFLNAIAAYERRLIAHTGIQPADLHRISGDPRSGYAMALSRDGQREQQRRVQDQFSEGDVAYIALGAILRNRWEEETGKGPGDLPEDGYRVEYQGIPKSPQEVKSDDDHIAANIELGLLDKVTAYQQQHPGTSKADAERALLDIQSVNARFRSA